VRKEEESRVGRQLGWNERRPRWAAMIIRREVRCSITPIYATWLWWLDEPKFLPSACQSKSVKHRRTVQTVETDPNSSGRRFHRVNHPLRITRRQRVHISSLKRTQGLSGQFSVGNQEFLVGVCSPPKQFHPIALPIAESLYVLVYGSPASILYPSCSIAFHQLGAGRREKNSRERPARVPHPHR
jgi:hypothetical protein